MPNCEGDGFETEAVHEKQVPLLFGKALWHRAQTGLASKQHSDVLVFSGNIRYASLIPGLLKAKKNKVASVLWGHHSSKAGGKTADLIREQLLFRLSDCILCYSHDVANRICENKKFANKTFVAPNAVDQDPIQQAHQHWLDRPDEMSAFQLDRKLDAGPNLLFVSRIKPRNKLETLIDVLANVKEKYPGATATIVGAHNDEQRRIALLAKERGLESAVLFPGAIYDETEIARWFMSADVFLYPAQIGLSLFHAFGYGLPVVAGVHPRNRNPELEALQHGVNGFQFDDQNPDEAAKHVLQVIDDPGLRAELSQSAIQTVTERFNIKTMAQHFLEAILFAAKTKGHSVD